METFVFQPRKPPRRRPRAEEQAAPTPPPAGVTILSVTATGQAAVVLVAFSGPVTVDEFVAPDGAFTVGEGGGGNPPISTAQYDATRAVVEMTSAVSVGQAWQLSAQPNWLVTPVEAPETGTVAA